MQILSNFINVKRLLINGVSLLQNRIFFVYVHANFEQFHKCEKITDDEISKFTLPYFSHHVSFLTVSARRERASRRVCSVIERARSLGNYAISAFSAEMKFN